MGFIKNILRRCMEINRGKFVVYDKPGSEDFPTVILLSANWSSNRLPDGQTDVIIIGTATLNSNASCRTLHINPAAVFTISPGYTLTVTH